MVPVATKMDCIVERGYPSLFLELNILLCWPEHECSEMKTIVSHALGDSAHRCGKIRR
jgi:hypothetical protein